MAATCLLTKEMTIVDLHQRSRQSQVAKPPAKAQSNNLISVKNRRITNRQTKNGSISDSWTHSTIIGPTSTNPSHDSILRLDQSTKEGNCVSSHNRLRRLGHAASSASIVGMFDVDGMVRRRHGGELLLARRWEVGALAVVCMGRRWCGSRPSRACSRVEASARH